MHFLDPIKTLTAPVLVNAQTGGVIAAKVEAALSSADRRRGLLGRDSLAAGSAFIISRCNAIHTVGMRFVIDVLFIDRRGRVRKIVHALPPWRIAISPLARIAIEFAAGELQAQQLTVGDCVYLAPGSSLANVAPRCDEGSSQNSSTSGFRSSAA